MRLSLRVFQVSDSRTSSFRAHVHGSPCLICDVAAKEFQDASGVSPQSDSSQAVSSSRAVHSGREERVSGGWLTVLERRREALHKWLQDRDKWSDAGQRGINHSHLNKCWEAFCDPAYTLTENEIAGTVDFLDQFCNVKLDDTLLPQTHAPSASHQEAFQRPTGNGAHNMGETSENAFLTHLRSRIIVPADIERQLRFQRTLLDFRHVANTLKLPFFLCCGTALGVHREGHFIPHDDDIDVGVFFEDLQAIDIGTEKDVQSAVVSILSHVALDGRFVLFDICGEVAKGLELRFLHHETRVALDLNVYYPPLSEDAELVAKFGPFVWAATHYEEAASRRHGMYRYRHEPFRSALTRVSFCDVATPRGDGFLVPPLRYVVECFGPDWETPRKFTYAEGLRGGEYKNMIEE